MSSRAGLVAALALAAALGCAGKKETGPAARDDAALSGFDASQLLAPGAARPVADGQAKAGAGARVAVAVTWPNAPAEMLDSVAVNRCGGELRAPISVHTLHGVRDVAVMLEGAVGGRAATPPGMVELTVEHCRVDPAVALAPRLGAQVAVTNSDERRHQVTIERVDGTGAEVVAELPLPVVGRRFEIVLDQPGVYRVVTAADVDSPAYLLVSAHPHAAITDDRGRVEFFDVAPGSYAVTAWHRPLVTGGPAMLARGSVVVVAEDNVALELSFTR